MGGRRFISKPLVKTFGFAVSLSFFLVPGVATAQSEWLTWGHDPERTGSNPDEKILSKDNVSQLELKWAARISTAPKEYVLSTMTAPVVATVNTPQGPAARVFVVGSDNTLFAIEAPTGKIARQKANPNTMKEPKKSATGAAASQSGSRFFWCGYCSCQSLSCCYRLFSSHSS
jgi:hypothetical protein